MARIPITDEIRAQLNAEKERTGVGSINLLGKGKEAPTYALLERWLGGIAKTAEEEHIAFVLDKWKALPDDPYIPLTKEIQSKLKRKLKATPMTLKEVAQKAGVKFSTMKSWLGSSKSLHKEELQRVLEAIDSGPAYPLADSVPEVKKKKPQYPKRKEKSPFAPIPKGFLKHLDRTGITKGSLWKRMPPDCRPDVGAFSSWGTRTKKARQNWIEAAMDILENLPDKPPPQERQFTLKEKEGYVPIPYELIEAIRDFMRQPGATYDSLIGPTPPQGMTRYLLNSWTAHQTRTAKPENLAYIEKRVSLVRNQQ